MQTAYLFSVFIVFFVFGFPGSVTASSSVHISQKAASLRDLINLKSTKTKKAKKYKCFLVDEDDNGNEVLIPVSSTPKKTLKHLNVDKRKFVYDDDADSNDHSAIQQKSNAYLPAAPPTLATTTQEPITTSTFIQTENGFETLTESKATKDVSSVFQKPINNLVTVSPLPVSVEKTVQRPKLKQVYLPRAHGFSMNSRHMNVETTTVPLEVVTAPRDAQNRPLVLSPEHCKQIKHYADMYGVRDVKGWVYNNCSFAQTYLPTASCEEINILVASCKNV